MKRILTVTLAVVLGLAVVTGAALYYFRSTTTRLTTAPDARSTTADPAASTRLPARPRSIVVIVEENKSYTKITNDTDASPYLTALGEHGAVFTQSEGIAHPSQPNYFALFSGQTNTNGDGCPAVGISPTSPNLASELAAAHRTFRAYDEDQPQAGYTGCTSAQFARKHTPWTYFTNIPSASWVPFSDLTTYEKLPDVAFIIPNLVHDMHSASIEEGDTWLKAHIEPLVAWANTNNTLVIITFDESSSPITNHIATYFVGPMVRPGKYGRAINHYDVLRTIEDLEGTAHAGKAAMASTILDCWKTS